MTSLDAHSAEQDLLLNAFHLSQRERNEASADDPWSAAGPSSVSPFVPCAFGRIPAALRAARLTADDVLWDLGCGDGRVLLQAAAQYGCRCVGLDIDADCIRDATAQAAACGLAERCVFATCDLLALPPRALRNGVAGADFAELGAALQHAAAAELQFPVPTAAFIFVTSHALTRLSDWLFGEWSRGGLRLLTCVEALDACFDFEAADPLFDSASSAAEWPVDRTHSAHGVFVVPPRETTLEDWAAAEPPPPPAPPTPAEADSLAPAALAAVLDAADISALCSLGDEIAAGDGEVAAFSFDDDAAAAEEYWHAQSEHRVVYLHRDGRLQAALPGLLRRVLQRIVAADADRWRLLVGRVARIRSAELHTYLPGGSVADPAHRDNGSLLTLSVLLSAPSEFEGARFVMADADGGEVAPPMEAAGDGVLFASERRHNVTTCTGGVRRAFVLELWEGAENRHNRHR